MKLNQTKHQCILSSVQVKIREGSHVNTDYSRLEAISRIRTSLRTMVSSRLAAGVVVDLLSPLTAVSAEYTTTICLYPLCLLQFPATTRCCYLFIVLGYVYCTFNAGCDVSELSRSKAVHFVTLNKQVRCTVR